MEKERKRERDHMEDRHETMVDSDEASLQGERLDSYVPKHSYCSERD